MGEVGEGAARETLLALQSPHLDAMDWLGRQAYLGLGGWKCSFCVLGGFLFCDLAFYGIIFNLVIFLVEGGESNAAAATTVATLSGTLLLSSFLGAILSDVYMGRLWTSLIFQILSMLFYMLVGISVMVTGSTKSLLLVSLYMMVVSTGPVLPNLLGLGVDQLNSNEDKETYFRLVAIATAVGQLLAATVVAYIDDAGMWAWGFWLCAISSVASLTLVAGMVRWFRHYRASGNPLLRNAQVLVAALRKCRLALPENSALLHECKGDTSVIPGCRKLPHTCTLRFFDKAAVVPDGADTSSRWQLCTVTQVEELKGLLRVIPGGISIIFFTVGCAQVSTLFEEQAILMNRHLGAWLVLPPASLNVLAVVSSIITGLVITASGALISRQCFRCIKQSHTQWATSLQLLGVALLCSIFAMVISALVELHRLKLAQKGDAISIMWLMPQTLLLGAGTNVSISSILDFFYTETSESMRSMAGCIALISCGAGNYLNSVLVTLITTITNHGGQAGWIADNLNEGHADYFYWFLASFLALGLGLHIAYAHAYRYTRCRYVDDNETV